MTINAPLEMLIAYIAMFLIGAITVSLFSAYGNFMKNKGVKIARSFAA